jgi:adenylosuccinate synthase
MVTELTEELGATIQEKGGEFGTTTERPRRCGWLDMVVVRRAVRLNSIDALLITKIDVLGDLGELKVCTGYTAEGERVEDFPADLDLLARCEPVYTTLPGWSDGEVKRVLEEGGAATRKGDAEGPGILGAEEYAGLPQTLRDYVQFIADGAGAPVDIISVGPGRHETFDLRGAPVTPRKG